ncbi:MAG: hypothetical protein BroJett007_32220 [Chloroflexota bacterium]|nr:CfrBI family restriction endonuclease [Anaerolineae bacterium CFX4]GIK30084.1 MAG: hypothetical protein BroJett007_32220 [Chloroflexota bacterium]
MRSKSMPTLENLLSSEALELIKATGIDLIETVGLEAVRDIVLDILCGRNIRSSTEILTRRRIVALNLALIDFVARGTAADPDFIERLPHIAAEVLTSKRTSKADQLLALWALGLTGKAKQNVLRDDLKSVPDYRDRYVETCNHIAERSGKLYGDLSGSIKLTSRLEVNLNWLVLAYLFNMIGSQTLTIRGSEKSTYGKFFEKLILGSLLHILGFSHESSGELVQPNRIFWLSSSGRGASDGTSSRLGDTEARESDATILYEPGRGVRIDIGFIGSGNTEISLDKVSRYRRSIELDGQPWFMGTLIIVDRIGPKSRLPENAARIGGTIVQMSAGYWPKIVAETLSTLLTGYSHPLQDMDLDDVGDFLEAKLKEVPLLDFIKSALDGEQGRQNPED